MSTSGSFPKIPISTKSGYIVMPVETFNLFAQAINVLGQMEITPSSNCGRVIANEGQFKLDFMDIDNRLRALESGTGIGSTNTIINNNPTTSVSITQQLQNITYRLDNMTANSVCVGNTVVTTFSV